MNTLRNKVSLIGRLGTQPEVLKFDGGTRVKMTFATNESYRDKNGDWIDNTQWHYLIGWGHVADRIARKLDKGTEAFIEGRLVHRQYETKNGEKRYATEIEVHEFLVLNSSKSAK